MRLLSFAGQCLPDFRAAVPDNLGDRRAIRVWLATVFAPSFRPPYGRQILLSWACPIPGCRRYPLFGCRGYPISGLAVAIRSSVVATYLITRLSPLPDLPGRTRVQ